MSRGLLGKMRLLFQGLTPGDLLSNELTDIWREAETSGIESW